MFKENHKTFLLFTCAALLLLASGCGGASRSAVLPQASSFLETPMPETPPAPGERPEPSAEPEETPEPTPTPTPLPKELYPTEDQLRAGVREADLFGFMPEDYRVYLPLGTEDENVIPRKYLDKDLSSIQEVYESGGHEGILDQCLVSTHTDLNLDGIPDYLTLWVDNFYMDADGRHGNSLHILLSDSDGGYHIALFETVFVTGNCWWQDGVSIPTRIDVMEETQNGIPLLRLTYVQRTDFLNYMYYAQNPELFGFSMCYYALNPETQKYEWLRTEHFLTDYEKQLP